MKRVVIESPFAGDIEANIEYAKLCVLDCLARGEAPYASHLFFTLEGLLDDTVPEERKLGMEAGFAWGDAGDIRAVYIDRGITPGMIAGIERAKSIGQVIDYRSLGRGAVSELTTPGPKTPRPKPPAARAVVQVVQVAMALM